MPAPNLEFSNLLQASVAPSHVSAPIVLRMSMSTSAIMDIEDTRSARTANIGNEGWESETVTKIGQAHVTPRTYTSVTTGARHSLTGTMFRHSPVDARHTNNTRHPFYMLESTIDSQWVPHALCNMHIIGHMTRPSAH